ncbi:transposase [Gordonia sp. LSe1-13]|uniref:Transposase n=1 Tax=Gordonia sesuvii TaxID=3116777 RepID=A0ABU7MEI3_9ACTN|nr:transposase [Gordonia sp. LSe1-13]
MTIARFRVDAAPVMAELFTQVLVACAQLGLGKLGVVALDGVKIASDASASTNRTEKGLVKAREAELARLRRQLSGTAEAAAREHALNDDIDDDDQSVPPQLLGSDRLDRIDEALQSARAHNSAAARAQPAADPNAAAKRRELRAQQRQEFLSDWLDRWDSGVLSRSATVPIELRVAIAERLLAEAIDTQQAKIDRRTAGQRGRRPKPIEQASEVIAARARLAHAHQLTDRWHAAQADRVARVEAAEAAATPPAARKPHRASTDTRRNITDPDSRPMPLRGGGWLQGYNCQAVTSEDGLILATSVGNGVSDCPEFVPMLEQAVTAADLITTHQPISPDDPAVRGIGTILADAGYLSQANILAEGPDRLIATSKSHKLPRVSSDAPPPEPDADAGPIAAMTYRLATDEGHHLYRRRSHIAETPFGNAKHNMGFRRFTSRRLPRAQAEFAFHAIVHNIMKAITGQHLATT